MFDKFSGWKVFTYKFGFKTRKSPRSRKTYSFKRALRFESLETRSLLSITVNTLTDENDGVAVGGISLRDAIQEVTTPNDTINFAPSLVGTNNNTLTLTHGEIQILGKSLTIDASVFGETRLTIDASGGDTSLSTPGNGIRIFDITDISTPFGSSPPTDTFKNLRLTSGDPGIPNTDVSTEGGAIRSRGRLIIQNCIIENNIASDGGAIHMITPGGSSSIVDTLIIHDSIIQNNLARGGVSGEGDFQHNVDGNGGGVWVRTDNGLFTMLGTHVAGNKPDRGGGGAGDWVLSLAA